MATFVQIPGIVEGRTGYIYKDLKIDRDIVANYHEYIDIEVEGTASNDNMTVSDFQVVIRE